MSIKNIETSTTKNTEPVVSITTESFTVLNLSTESPTTIKKSSWANAVIKPQTLNAIKNFTENDTEYINRSPKATNSCITPSDITNFTKLNQSYKRPLVKMQTMNQFSETEIKDSEAYTKKTESSNDKIIKVERLIDYTYTKPSNENIEGHSTADFKAYESPQKIARTHKKSKSSGEESSYDATSIEAFNFNRKN